jgi:tetratricopeptide (TPR) repeat protein
MHSDPDGAVDLLQQAVEQEPRDAYHRYLLGKALTRSGRPQDALEPLRRAKRMEPRKAFIDLELIRALAESGRESDALEHLRPVARHCHAWDAYNGGRLALRLGETELARSLLERSIRRGPTRGDSR